MSGPRGVIAIVRLDVETPDAVHDALVDGGVEALEVTLPTPGSLETIGRWRTSGRALVGAGTVRTVDDVGAAVSAGAQFLVTPTTSPGVLAAATAARLPVLCGALTPSEIEAAWRLGAEAVKVFPAGAVGGPSYVAAVQAPLPDIPLMPTGGVDPATTRAYAALGCRGVGVGSALVSDAAVASADWELLRHRAHDFVTAWRGGVVDRGGAT